MRVLRKLHMILLEIVIALALVALCILPLIGPHIEIVRSHLKFAKLMELDRAANLIYVDLLEQMHRNSLPFPDIKNPHVFPLNLDHLSKDKTDFPAIEASYKFTGKSKGNESARLYLLQLHINVKPKGASEEEASKEFTYPVCVLRNMPTTENSAEQND